MYQQAVPLFKPSKNTQASILYARDILVKSPRIERVSPKDLGVENWTSVLLISADLAKEKGIPSEPTETLEEILGAPLCDPDALVICEAGTSGRSIFTRFPIKKGTYICPYGGILNDIKNSLVSLKFTPKRALQFNERFYIDADSVYHLSGYFQHLPAIYSHSYNGFACQNMISVTISYRGISFPMLQALRDIDAGEVLGFDYGKEMTDTFDVKRWSRTGEEIRNPSIVEFSSLTVLLCKYYLMTLQNSNRFNINNQKFHNAYCFITKAICYHRDILFSLSKEELDILISLKEILEAYLSVLIEDKDNINFRNLAEDSLSAYSALKSSNWKMQPPTAFNSDSFFSSDSSEEFSVLQDFLIRANYQYPSADKADELSTMAINDYRNSLKNTDQAQSREQIVSAISNWQDALKIYRILSQKNNIEQKDHYLLFEDTILVLDDKVATSYWNLGSAYMKLGMYKEACYCLKRCLFLKEKDQNQVIKLKKSINDIQQRLNECQSELDKCIAKLITDIAPSESNRHLREASTKDNTPSQTQAGLLNQFNTFAKEEKREEGGEKEREELSHRFSNTSQQTFTT